MLREFVVSTAMHALGIPTTRSLAVVGTGRTVQRETAQPGAVLARTAASHLRVGSFQLARATDDTGLLRRLLDHAIARHAPAAADAEVPALALYEHVVAAQAELVAQWMLVGFVHGVMNTDNMTISGETIDYGPCAFLDAHDADTVFSSIDSGGRYRYGNQPLAAQWNLAGSPRRCCRWCTPTSTPRSPGRSPSWRPSSPATRRPGPPACAPSSAWARTPTMPSSRRW